MTTIRKKLTGLQTPQSVREQEAAFRNKRVDCSDIPELEEKDFKRAVRLEPGEARIKTEVTRFQIYKDKSGFYRWRLLAPDHSILAVSTTGYSTRKECTASIVRTSSAVTAAVSQLDPG